MQGNVSSIVLIGPEASGKTTLAKRLAAHFGTSYSLEFVRLYLEGKHLATGSANTESGDVLPIAYGQLALEKQAKQNAKHGLVIHDTNVLSSWVYTRHYFPQYADQVISLLTHEDDVVYFILPPIFSISADDPIRDIQVDRWELMDAFEEAVRSTGKPYALLSEPSDRELEHISAHLTRWGVSLPQ